MPLVLQQSAQATGSAQLSAPPPAEQPQQNLPKLPAVIQLIDDNVFNHRKRKEQDEDDIMVCHCPPPWRGGDGCGPNCINRMLCIECTEVSCLFSGDKKQLA
jgi:histone-lysine N-methyltransferase SETD2